MKSKTIMDQSSSNTHHSKDTHQHQILIYTLNIKLILVM